MPVWSCFQCGAQFPESHQPPRACPVCEDERQFVNWSGQRWLAREDLAKQYKLVWRDDLGIPGIAVEPSFAIAQRALLLRESDGCVMWDCIPLWRGRGLERSLRQCADLSAWRRSHLRHPAPSGDRALVRRDSETLG
jgi:hypothetical protein